MSKTIIQGIDPTQEKYEKTKKFINRAGVYNILNRTVTHLLPNRTKDTFLELNMGGGSYTDGRKIVVGVLPYVWGEDEKIVFSTLKALVGHETAHVIWSDFDLFLKFQYMIAVNFGKCADTGVLDTTFELPKFNNKKEAMEQIQKLNGFARYGVKLGAHLLNSTEDGGIERLLGENYKGYVKHIQLLNGIIWDNQPVKGENPLQEFLFCITSLCVTGMKSKDWGKIYGASDLDLLIEEVRPLITKAINHGTAIGRAEATFELYLKIARIVLDLLKQQQNAIDDLPNDLNFSGGQGQEGQEGNGSSSTHLTSQENQQQEQSSGGEKNEEESQQGSGVSSSNGQQDEQQDNQKGEQQGHELGGTNQENQPSSSSQGQQSQGQQTKNQSSSNAQDDSLTGSQDEQQMVDDLLRGLKDGVSQETEKDLENAQREDEKIRQEEERKKKESGNLSDSELEDVIAGRGTANSINVRNVSIRGNLPAPVDVTTAGKKLRKELEKILLDKPTYNARYQRRGVLDANALWRIGVKETDVFEKKGKPVDSSFVVNVLVDNSGSMTEYARGKTTKKEFAQMACGVLEEALKGLVPFRISAFDYSSSGINHLVISDFGDTERDINRTFSTHIPSGNLNYDSVSIRVATKELLNRPEKKKILFVLSDGLPSAYDSGKEAIACVRDAVRDARKAGILVVAICFGTEKHLENTRESYKQMYQKGIIMVTPEKIPTQIVKILEREIR